MGTLRSRREGSGVWGVGIPLPSGGTGLGRGLCPRPRIFFDFFLSDNGAFSGILGACFNVSIRSVKQESKSRFVCQLAIGQLSDMADVSIHIHISYT